MGSDEQKQIRMLRQEIDRLRGVSPGMGWGINAGVPTVPEGSWTPTYFGATTAGVTTYTTQTGNYKLIGPIVFAQFELVWTGATGTGVVRIGGLPFTSAVGVNFAFPVETVNVTFANGSIQGILQGNQVVAQLFSPATNAAGTELTVEAAGTIRGMIIYFTTSGGGGSGGGGGGGSGAPADAEYWVETANATLTNEIVVGTTGITTAADASRPAAAKAGRLFLPNNGLYIDRDTGSAWESWGPIWQMTRPVDANFSWRNQGSASVDTTNGGIYLSTPSSGAGFNLRCREYAAPATPYTITAAFIPLLSIADIPFCGIGWCDGTKLVTPAVQNNAGTFQLAIFKWNSVTSYNSAYLANTNAPHLIGGPLIWFQISDDGTNRISRISRDGYNWIQLHTVGRTDFLTATTVLFFVSVGSGTSTAALTLVDWKQS